MNATNGKNKCIRLSFDSEYLLCILIIFKKKYMETNSGIKSLPNSLYLANLINKKQENKMVINKLKFIVLASKILPETNIKKVI
tara:strand:- start:37 stop:288 length:252 start_codon:yes stop_codon:yes gene_type:complete